MGFKPRKRPYLQGRLLKPSQKMREILTVNRLRQLIMDDGWIMKILLVMFGGSIGALSRYGVSLLAAQLFGTRFPWGTLIVNLSGCFLIGLSFALAERGLSIMNPSMRLFFVTGYLGALTTFSTFGLETVNSMRGGNPSRRVGQLSFQQPHWWSLGFSGHAGGPLTVRWG